MQLMPHTAKLVSRKLRIKYSRARLLLDPAYNIRLGQTYLKQMLNQFNGSVIMALTAYNAGPHRVRRLIRTLGQPGPSVLDMVDWIEQIPFTETRNYVQRVLENRTVYHSRTNDIRVAIFLDEKFKIAAAVKAKKPILVPILSEEAARVRKADQIFKKDVEK